MNGLDEDMKQKLIIIIALICIACLLTATIVSANRAKTLPRPDKETDSEADAPEEQESSSEVTSGTETEAETESSEIGGIPFVTYTGESYAGTGIAYRGTGEKAQYVIVIDAGHQKHAMSETEPIGPGAEEQKAKVTGGTQGSFTGLAEHELNLRVALALRDVLVARGYTVVMVRETSEVEISNAERAQLANTVGADVNIRIHANGDDDASLKGAMAVCQTPANPYNADIYTECRALSDAVLASYCEYTGIAVRNVWETDTMTGTNWAQVPTTIIEMGFMTNAEDDAAMAAEDFAPKAAEGIAAGIISYLAQYAPGGDDSGEIGSGDEQTTDPAEGTTDPEQTTDPGEDTVDPGEDTTEPGEDTTEPGEDTTAPPEGTTVPEEETTKREQETGFGAKYDIDYDLEAEVDEYFTELETIVEFTATEWIRTEPSLRGGTSTQVNIKTYAGLKVQCIGMTERWCRILIDGKVYYASTMYLKVVSE